VDRASPGESVTGEALILVDMQTGFLQGGAAVPHAEPLVRQLKALLVTARTAGALVVQLQNGGSPGAIDEPGQPGWCLHLPPMPGEPVLRKSSDDGFAGTNLEELLSERGVPRATSSSSWRTIHNPGRLCA